MTTTYQRPPTPPLLAGEGQDVALAFSELGISTSTQNSTKIKDSTKKKVPHIGDRGDNVAVFPPDKEGDRQVSLMVGTVVKEVKKRHIVRTPFVPTLMVADAYPRV
jgi:hypothetical protein